MGGDLNCITKKIDCTHNPESKQSPSLARLVNTFDLLKSYGAIHPHSKTFSRYYSGAGGYVGASRIDRSYHWGNVAIEEASYISVAFSDHFAFSIKISLPILSKILPPQCRPLLKISPEVVHDREFKARLETEMVVWQQVKNRGLNIMKWWELIVKPGIRKLAIQRSKELNKCKRSRMNCLLLKQGFFTKELQAGNLHIFAQLRQVKDEIQEWYELESRKVVLQARVNDVQQSEKVRIFHHEQHIKLCKKSAILRLDTEEGLLAGHEACLIDQVTRLLGQPAVLDPIAQDQLLAEVVPVFTADDIRSLKAVPEKELINLI